jgi:thioesterase domain-containing protein
MDAIEAYRSKHYGGDLLVFPAQVQDPTKLPGLFYGWRTLVKRLKIVPAPGEHGTMLKPPHVEQLAALLGPYLQRVAKGRGPLK